MTWGQLSGATYSPQLTAYENEKPHSRGYGPRVKQAGSYALEIPVASKRPGGTFHIEFDGKDATGPIVIPDTGGWDQLKTLKLKGVALKAGKQQMKIVMDKDGASGGIGDIDLVRFIKD